MKTITKLALLLCSVLVLSACSKDDDDKKNEAVNYPAGEIPGLGEEPGELTGTPFKLPAGIEMQGIIKGLSSSIMPFSTPVESSTGIFQKKEKSLVEKQQISLRASAKAEIVVGSGHFVRVLILLNNNNDRDTEITFPAGLIVRALSSKNQNGVLLKKTSVTVPKKGSLAIGLVMYCGNSHRSPSGSSDEYEWGVITDSQLILDLCDRLKNKKINFEEFNSSNYDTFSEQVNRLQSILWSLTDYPSEMYEGLSEWDKEYIDKLPNSDN